ncbi:hypothetical protein T4A_10547 [Trichinella pseudospiralis]|uniref:Uncharacterized protein n=1 Tax=Trichinella pseudospiralis TaxID=6337 RepID=A0A0V1DQ56_TRIPS|nr:hypothetical protein T4A_10547 [Trichinella pseudospiralis]
MGIMGKANVGVNLFHNYWIVFAKTLQTPTKFRNFRDKIFIPKITGVNLYRSGIMSEL